jgi:hypothetical protein
MERNLMRRAFSYIAIIAAALLLSASGQPANAQPGKSGGSNAGGVAASRMSEKGLENNNAQWSADPERGWLRAEERHELHKKGKSQPGKKQFESSRGKAKGSLWEY